MSHKPLYIRLLAATLLIVAFVGMARQTYRYFKTETVTVTKGTFYETLETVGELMATRSTDIEVPQLLRNRDLPSRPLKIINLVPEGTLVKPGDFVAALDPTDLEEFRREARETLDEYERSMESGRLDSGLVLTEARNAIRQAREKVEDQQLLTEQAIFESQAFQRQAAIELDVTRRNLLRTIRSMEQQQRKYEGRLQRFGKMMQNVQNRLNLLNQILEQLTIHAPSGGMVVYARGDDRLKIKTGSYVSIWNPTITLLPDLNSLVSDTYLKEVDYSKIKPGMPVKITIDALPGTELDGTIAEIANMGQTIPGENQIGFKTTIALQQPSTALLPGMTTLNQIVLNTYPNVLLVSRTALCYIHGEAHVVRHTFWGAKPQKVKVISENEQLVRIESSGLKEGDRLSISK